MQDVTDGNINCVIVKDLSRLGREYIETGRYLRRVFPAYSFPAGIQEEQRPALCEKGLRGQDRLQMVSYHNHPHLAGRNLHRKRHLRHYRHTRAARGSGVHPRNVHVDDHMLC